MDKRSDDIRQDIESTRASLDEKIDLLQNKAAEAVDQAKQTFDVKHQVNERPWVALGLALAAGYVVGNLGNNDTSSEHNSSATYNYGTSSYSGPSKMDAIKSKSQDFLSQFDDEIDLLKVAAITTLTQFIRDTAREAIPALAPQIDRLLNERGMGGTGTNSFASGSQGGATSGASGSYAGTTGGSSGSYAGATSGTSTTSGMGASSDLTSSSGYTSGSSLTAGSSTGTSSSDEHGSFSRTTAPNASMDTEADAGRINHDAIPADMNRYGNPPPTPSRDEQDYYTTYQPDEDERSVSGKDRY